jgi:integrase
MAIDQMVSELKRMGLGRTLIDTHMPQVLVSALLISHSPKLEDISLAALEQVRNEVLPPSSRRACVTVSRALVNLGIFPHPLMYARMGPVPQAGVDDYVSADWMAWCRRWHVTSTQALRTRNNNFTMILKIGRWLAVHYPTISSPAQWTREMATACLAAIDRMKIGQWIHPKTTHLPTHLLGKPFRPNSKAALLAAVRTFFIDCQEWKWIPIYFDPRRTLALPRSIATLRGPNPRIMENDIWAKLLHAGLTLTADDLPVCTYRVKHQAYARVAWYPIEMVRALVMVWLFAGLRSDEIYRLRVDCVRWQNDKPEDLQQSTPKSICLLEVPINKTNQAFVKPVDRLVGEAIEIWQKKRPCFVPQWDSKNGELVNFLFVYRGKRFGKQYLNQSVIPMLCRKAGVPESDARGRITSHRARSTIATQLYNAREPMSLFELQEWLGHRSPSSTQQYAKIFPTKLAQAYKDAEYFSRNTRMIEVLLDQEAIQNGAATKGEPWKYYDLGHGYCTYDFFDQCAHRMACAKCSFYRPKSSSQGQLLEGKKHLQRMLQAIPLLEDERAAVEDGIEAMDKLLQRLAHQPTPSGEIPKQLAEVHMPEKT